jgi:pilus assembly protein CpaE
MTHRLLLAIGDAELARNAAALVREGEGLQVADIVSDAEELHRALQRLDIDVVVLHDALGSVPVMDIARELGASFPEVGLVLIAEESPEILRMALQAGLRDVVSLPLSLEQLESSVSAAAQWSRTVRDRVAGEESAAGALGGPLVAVAGAKGGVGTTTVVLQLAMAAVRAAPGRPVCVVDFDLQKGDFRSYLDAPYRRSVVDLVDVAQELSVRHLQETLYTHKDGFRVLLSPDEGERAEEVGPIVARNVLTAVKARHALTLVDLGANVSEASAVGADVANRLIVVTTPDVVALRGVRRMRELWKRVQVREEDDVIVVLNRTSRKLEIQPDLARKVVAGRMAQTTIPADFGAFEGAINTGSPARMEKLRSTYESLAAEIDALPGSDEEEPAGGESRGLLARLGGERGQSTVEFMGLLPFLIVLLLGLWQLGLTGYTYLLASHAAREGARELATDPTDEPNKKPYRDAALAQIPKAWKQRAEVEKSETVTVKVRLRVPVVMPGLESPIKISSQADTSTETAPLPPRQARTPTPTPTPRGTVQ